MREPNSVAVWSHADPLCLQCSAATSLSDWLCHGCRTQLEGLWRRVAHIAAPHAARADEGRAIPTPASHRGWGRA